LCNTDGSSREQQQEDGKMSCPYSDEELQEWDGVTNPMGAPCYSCEDWDCEHNENEDHPERIPFDEDESMIHHSNSMKAGES
jgi:hypothetical protein